MVGTIAATAPPGWLKLENCTKPINLVIRACGWKIRYAQMIQMSRPDTHVAEQRARDLRRRLVSLSLRNVQMPSSDTCFEAETSSNQCIPTASEIPLLKQLASVRYIPIKLVVLGEPSIGRTTSIMKYLRSYPLEDPYRDEAMDLMTPSIDRFGNKIFTTNEKGSGLTDFQITIVDPPSHNEAAQIAALRGADAVIVGFSINDKPSIEAATSKWVPFVRQWLGPAAPITAMCFKLDVIGNEIIYGSQIFSNLMKVGIKAFEVSVPPFKKSFWRAWNPPGCPFPDGSPSSSRDIDRG